ncbi:MAG: hypothetical protein QHH10_08240 [Peptococcaceae bacterium]|jgi:hypothetical protein|nr:hypothetical protein [Peptococcaceae bacterium]MDH7525283.1 hypothetical protein [Peptococcaceae bacterium]
MIRLLKPYNHLGGLIPDGAIVSLGDIEAMLVKNGVAEYYCLEKEFEQEPEQNPEKEAEQEPEQETETPLRNPPLGRKGRK